MFLAQFKFNEIFMILALDSAKMPFFMHFKQNQRKKAIFSKKIEISIFSKIFIFEPIFMKSKYDGCGD